MKALVLSVQQSASAGASKDGFAEKSFARYRKKRAVEELGAIEYRNCQSALACMEKESAQAKAMLQQAVADALFLAKENQALKQQLAEALAWEPGAGGAGGGGA